MQSATKLRIERNSFQGKGKVGEVFLVAWSWTMKAGSDLDIPRKGTPREETVWEGHRGIKPWARPENNTGRELCTAATAWIGSSTPSSWQRHQDSGIYICILGGDQWKYLKINLQDYTRTLKKNYWKMYPDVTALLSYFSFSQSQRLLEVSSGLDHASLE